jgi:hypothetical protein
MNDEAYIKKLESHIESLEKLLEKQLPSELVYFVEPKKGTHINFTSVTSDNQICFFDSISKVFMAYGKGYMDQAFTKIEDDNTTHGEAIIEKIRKIITIYSYNPRTKSIELVLE